MVIPISILQPDPTVSSPWTASTRSRRSGRLYGRRGQPGQTTPIYGPSGRERWPWAGDHDRTGRSSREHPAAGLARRRPVPYTQRPDQHFCTPTDPSGPTRSGLQIPVQRFDSARRLHVKALVRALLSLRRPRRRIVHRASIAQERHDRDRLLALQGVDLVVQERRSRAAALVGPMLADERSPGRPVPDSGLGGGTAAAGTSLSPAAGMVERPVEPAVERTVEPLVERRPARGQRRSPDRRDRQRRYVTVVTWRMAGKIDAELIVLAVVIGLLVVALSALAAPGDGGRRPVGRCSLSNCPAIDEGGRQLSQRSSHCG